MRLKGFDFLILFTTGIISILGLSMIWSLEPSLFSQQLIFWLLGFFFFWLFAKIDFRVLVNLSWSFYFGSLFFLLLTFVLGEVTRGSVRWIQLGGFNIQPSEIAKPFLVIFFASFLASEERLALKRIFAALLLLSLPFLFILKQPDLGSTLVILASFLSLVLASNLSWVYFLAGFLALLVLSPVAWFFLHDYQKARILSFLNPYSDPLGSGYHVIQSVIAVGSGGLFGRGLGKGTQSHLAFLPEHHTDFMFASLVEELGLIGAAVLLIGYLLILYRILKIAQNSNSFVGSMVCYGFFGLLLFQIFVNVGMNMGMMPITGITLPLVSYGGSSLLATMICLGIVESIAQLQKPESTIEIR